MRRTVAYTVPPSMFRHFAIVTLAITAGLAMFADGEGREAQAAQLSRPAPARPAAPATLARAPDPEDEFGSWGDESDFDDGGGGGFGSPTESFGGGSDYVADLADVMAPGYPPEYLESLSEEERALLLQGLQANGMLTPEIRRQRRAALSAASDRRSGTSSGEV